RGVEYFITTTNAGGVDSRAPSSGVISIPVSLPNGLTASVPGGSSADQYGLISLPGRLESPAARDVFEDDLGPYDVSAWRLYSLGTRATLTELNTQPFDIEPGHSYWMLTAASNRVYNSGATISNRTDTLFPIRLEAGWNLVANPFSFPIPRTNLSTSSIQPIDLWSFAGTWRSNADTLLPFSGYAFFSAQTDTLWVDPDLTPSNVDANRASHTEHRTSNPNLAVQGVRRSQLEALFGTSAGNPPPTPSNHALDIDVYPNPFFGATTIGYELPSDERVTIRIFDVVGRLVVTLLDERQEAGFHSVTWGVSEGTISSGLYLVQVQAGDTVWSQPISRTK
ncbi:MAG: T9SS type A sorting domain-containing protein, partial [Rhodothermales bacterium]